MTLHDEPTLVGSQWHFPDETILPLVSGGSDVPVGLPPEPTIESLAPTQSDPIPTTEPEPETIGNTFLKNADPRDVPVLEKYIKDWDKGVNARFREIHQEYAPYKQLNTPIEDIQAAIQVYQLIDQNPQRVLELLAEELGVSLSQAQQQQQQEVSSQTVDPAFDGLPEPFVGRFSKLEQTLDAIAQTLAKTEQEKKTQLENQKLESLISDLKKKHGEFDEEAVLLRMSKGMKPDQAVADYKSWLQNLINQQAANRRPVPPILGGNGAVPNGTDLAKASRKDAQSAFAGMLSQTLKNQE